MYEHYSLIACVGVALINLVLSVSIPALLNKRDNGDTFINNARMVYSSNRELILTSTLIVLVATFLAIEFKPSIETVVESVECNLISLSKMFPSKSNIKHLADLH